MHGEKHSSALRPIDSHCHLDFPLFSKDIRRVVTDAQRVLEAVVTSAVDPARYAYTVQLSKRYPGFVYAALGHEPQKTRRLDVDATLDDVSSYVRDIVALGEIGLDYYWVKDPEIRLAQYETLNHYLDFAKTRKLPVVIHSRKAEEDCVNIVEEHSIPSAYFHCFDGNPELVDRIRRHKGWMIGVATNVVYRKKTRQLASSIPLEHLLIETDSPFLHPFERKNRNEPSNVLSAAKCLATIHDRPLEDIVASTSHNAISFFQLKTPLEKL
ncbi:MAG: TatD family hydrolase [Candidatus Ranarchaeia archaeon]